MFVRHASALIALTATLAASPNAQEIGQAARAPTPPPAQAVRPLASNVPTDGPDISRSAFIQAMDADYRRRDLNSDGKITRSEVEQYERANALAQAQASNRALFLSLDTDRNGVLSPNEFSAMVKAPAFIDVSPIMQRFDQNKDQIITIVEYRTGTLFNFDRLDVDKDGVLTAAESKAIDEKPVIQGR